ncbi:hypothetical protein ABEB36_000978 [Hypothenemus hampei]|uniref:Uncharacterized protein n=1 Tax=Hypothenemus hampei TaxID=57062 RepID=A0ABD1FD56_HYPHA
MSFKTIILCLFVINFHRCLFLTIESNFYQEEPCAQTYGYCVLENECPKGLTSESRTLCSSQQNQGAVCCTNISQNDVNCYQLHNDCRSNCPQNLNLGTRGCPENQVCCSLV